MTLKTGTLRHRVLIEDRIVVSDPLGGEIVTWVPIATLAGDGMVWANVRFLSGIETLRTDAVVASLKASIRIQFRSDILATARITYDGRVFNISSPPLADAETGRDYLDLPCESGLNNG